jgi:hypothetical protein
MAMSSGELTTAGDLLWDGSPVDTIGGTNKERIMDHKKTDDVNQKALRTLTDDQIVTERKLPRRSFLTVAGAFVAGATAIVAGTRATSILASPQDDPDKKKEASDPDKKKEASAPDKKAASDPDKKKETSDPDK